MDSNKVYNIGKLKINVNFISAVKHDFNSIRFFYCFNSSSLGLFVFETTSFFCKIANTITTSGLVPKKKNCKP